MKNPTRSEFAKSPKTTDIIIAVGKGKPADKGKGKPADKKQMKCKTKTC